MNKQITVLVPTFNSSKFIIECISSALAQQEPDINIAISDNASSDSTVYDVRSFLQSNTGGSSSEVQRVSLHVHEKNLGAFGNLRHLISDHRERFCYVLCSDDYFSSVNSLSLVTEEIIKVGANHSLIAFVDNTTNLNERRRIISENGSQSIQGQKGLALFFLNGNIPGGLSNLCVNGPMLPHDVNFKTEYVYFGDFRFYIDVLAAGGKIWMSNNEICFRRHHPDSGSNTGGKIMDVVISEGFSVT
jgi:glycosyltransferase involved in cell wall biosynthesis